MEDLWRLSATDVAAAVKSKKVSAKEAATAALARLDAVNPAINAVVDHRPEDVLAQAAAIDAAIARNEAVGPLAGVPVTVKVNIDQEGFATTNGLKLQRDLIARSNSPVIDNLRKAGAVILGRTNCPAFSYRWFTTNLHPWRHQKSARSRHHAGRLVRRRGRGGRGRHRPYRAWHRYRGIDPLSGLCLRRSRPAADGRPDRGLQCVAARTHHRRRRSARYRVRWRAPSAISGSRWRRCRAATCAIPGGCRRRSKAPPMPKRAALCLQPDGLETVPEVKAAVADAAKRLERAGWTVEEVETRRRCARPRTCRPSCGSATAMKRNWTPPSAKAIPARWPACAATAQRCFRSMPRPSPRR